MVGKIKEIKVITEDAKGREMITTYRVHDDTFLDWILKEIQKMYQGADKWNPSKREEKNG